MKKFVQNKLKDQKGMTLIELLAVIVIIAIIAAIAIPAIGNIIDNSRVGAIKSDALSIVAAGELYFIDHADKTTVDLATLKADNFVDDIGSFDKATATEVVVTQKTASERTKIKGTGKTGKISVEFDGATKANINEYANNAREKVGNITASKE